MLSNLAGQPGVKQCCELEGNLIDKPIPIDHPNHGAKITLRECKVCGARHWRGRCDMPEVRIPVGEDLPFDPSFVGIVCVGV